MDTCGMKERFDSNGVDVRFCPVYVTLNLMIKTLRFYPSFFKKYLSKHRSPLCFSVLEDFKCLNSDCGQSSITLTQMITEHTRAHAHTTSVITKHLMDTQLGIGL